MFKRIIGIAVVTVMLLSLFAACGNSKNSNTTTSIAPSTLEQSTKAEEKKPVELTLWVGSREQDDFTNQMEQKFLSQYPYIKLNKVVHEGDAGNDYFLGVATGTAPDVIQLSYAQLPKCIKAGVVLPLNEYLNKWEDYKNFPKSEQDLFTDKDGKVYTLVRATGNLQLAYNKKLFAEAGIQTPPKTWDELLADAKLLTKPEKQQAGYGMLTGEFSDWWFEFYVWQAGGDLIKNDNGKAVLTFTDPAAIKAANFYKELRKSKVTQSDFTMKFGDMVKAFATGKIAMMPFAGDWLSWAVSLGAKAEDIGFALQPAGPNGQIGIGVSYGTGSVINPRSSKEKQDAAWEYIKYYSTKDYNIENIKNKASKGAVNPVPLIRSDMTYADAGVMMAPEIANFLADSIKTSKPEIYGRAVFTKFLDKAIQKIALDPNSDPQKELQDAQDQATKEALDSFNK